MFWVRRQHALWDNPQEETANTITVPMIIILPIDKSSNLSRTCWIARPSCRIYTSNSRMRNERLHVIFDGPIYTPFRITVSRAAEERTRRTADRPYTVLMEVHKWIMFHHFAGSVLFEEAFFCCWALTQRVCITIDARYLKHVFNRNAVVLWIYQHDWEV